MVLNICLSSRSQSYTNHKNSFPKVDPAAQSDRYWRTPRMGGKNVMARLSKTEKRGVGVRGTRGFTKTSWPNTLFFSFFFSFWGGWRRKVSRAQVSKRINWFRSGVKTPWRTLFKKLLLPFWVSLTSYQKHFKGMRYLMDTRKLTSVLKTRAS